MPRDCRWLRGHTRELTIPDLGVVWCTAISLVSLHVLCFSSHFSRRPSLAPEPTAPQENPHDSTTRLHGMDGRGHARPVHSRTVRRKRSPGSAQRASGSGGSARYVDSTTADAAYTPRSGAASAPRASVAAAWRRKHHSGRSSLAVVDSPAAGACTHIEF